MSDNSAQSGYNAGYLAWVGLHPFAPKSSDGLETLGAVTPEALRLCDAESGGEKGRQLDCRPGSEENQSVVGKEKSMQAPPRREVLHGVASRIATNMQMSLTVPTATSFRAIPARVLEHNRRLINNHPQTQGGGRCSFTHLIAYALVQSLKVLPTLNAHCVQRDGRFVRVQPHGVNLGLAISISKGLDDSKRFEGTQGVENKGAPEKYLRETQNFLGRKGTKSLVVPNVKDAQTLDFGQFVAAYDDLVRRARSGQLRPADLQGTTVTLTNPGGVGTEASLPRLMPGQGLIVACGRIGYPAAYADSDPALLHQLGVGKVFTLSSTYDHRIIQGAESGLLLARMHGLLVGKEPFYQPVFTTLGVSDEPLEGKVPSPPGQVAAQPLPCSRHGLCTAETCRYCGTFHSQRSPKLLVRSLFSIPALETRVRSSDEGEGRNPGDQNTLDAPANLIGAGNSRKRQGTQSPPWVEFQHIRVAQERDWWARQLECGCEELSNDRRLALFNRLLRAESFEQFLHKRFVGHKRFSLEGTESLIVMLDALLERAAHGGGTEVAIGMPHRGRLNVLAHVIGKPYEAILADFMGRCVPDGRFALGPMGDVKYHAGGRGVYRANMQKSASPVLEQSGSSASQNVASAESGGDSAGQTGLDRVEKIFNEGGASAAGLRRAEVAVWMAHNPSHLESVNSVLQGMARAAQDRLGQQGKQRVVPVLLHGDASFAGQGVVYESLQLARLPAYDTGGTVHIVVDNQIGYTTPPCQGRSCLQCTDIARAFDLPVLHVENDDPEACAAAAELAFRARMHFGKDVLLHLIGTRRHGHNEGDDPSLTQPLLYRTIQAHPTVATQYGDHLARLGLLSQDARHTRQEACRQALEQASKQAEQLSTALSADGGRSFGAAMEKKAEEKDSFSRVATAVLPEILQDLAKQIFRVPAGFTPHPRARVLLQRRAQAVDQGRGIDMGTAETLAYASLLTQGVPVRLCGQDSERGTFAHRHAVLHDTVTGQTYTPLRHITCHSHAPFCHPERNEGASKQSHAVAPFAVYNSPLSEAAALGFEYGYSVGAPAALVLWEAQFGDFCNGAQVHIDQYVAAGQAKWGQRSRVVLVLPHGHDGAGPEHSSARPERFLQLCAGGNLRVATCVRAAQLFHLLRAQALGDAVPLVLLLPKSLLRSAQAAGDLTEFTAGKFEPVIAPGPEQLMRARRLVLCSGKVFHELLSLPQADPQDPVGVATIQVQQLYPFPEKELKEILQVSRAQDVVWLQEEPKNMGAWSFCAPRLRALLREGQTLRYIGRAPSASPATGYANVHQRQQHELLQTALEPTRGSTNDVEIN